MMITDDFGNQVPSPHNKTIHERLEQVEQRLAEGDASMSEIKADLAANTVATKDLAAAVKDVIEFFSTLTGAAKALDLLGKMAKPMGYIVGLLAGVVSLWLAVKAAIWGGMR